MRHGRIVVYGRWEFQSGRAAEKALQQVQPSLVVAWGVGDVAHAVVQRAGVGDAPMLAVAYDYCMLEIADPVIDVENNLLRSAYASTLRAGARLVGIYRRPVRPEHWVFCSHAVRAEYEQRLGQLANADVVYHGVDVPARRPPLPQRDGRLRVGAVARLVPEKGLHTLLAAVEILARENPSTAPSLEVRGPRSDFHLAYAARLGVAVEAAQAAGADVELGPSLTDSEYRAWLQRQHCIVTPAEWPEPFALVPLEAMAAGRPVVTTTLGGTAELVEDGVNALTFPAGNASALARSLARLRDEPGLAERIADGGFQRVSRRHRREQMAASLDAIVAAVGGRSQR